MTSTTTDSGASIVKLKHRKPWAHGTHGRPLTLAEWEVQCKLMQIDYPIFCVTKNLKWVQWAMRLCIQHGMRSCQYMSILAWFYAVPSFRSRVNIHNSLRTFQPSLSLCVVVVEGYTGWVMWCLTLASLEHHSNPLWNGFWNQCSTSFGNQDFPHGFAGRNHYIEQKEVFGQVASNVSGCPVWKPFFTSVLLPRQYYVRFAMRSKCQGVWQYWKKSF